MIHTKLCHQRRLSPTQYVLAVQYRSLKTPFSNVSSKTYNLALSRQALQNQVRPCTWRMIHTKIHLISPRSGPVALVQNRGPKIKHHSIMYLAKAKILDSQSKVFSIWFDPAPGAWFIPKFISLAKVISLPVQNRGPKTLRSGVWPNLKSCILGARSAVHYIWRIT